LSPAALAAVGDTIMPGASVQLAAISGERVFISFLLM